MDKSCNTTADITAIDKDDIETIKNKIVNKEISLNEALIKYNVNVAQILPKYEPPSKHDEKKNPVFTKEQEKALKEHIIKCYKVQYGLTIPKMRAMTYEYAVKLPGCNYPKEWDVRKMASMEWFKKFRARHYDLKNLWKKNKNTCICIMGCHMGPEGKNELNKLEARVLIAKVYNYLHQEYEYMKMSNDLSLLINVLRRTAEATGVCEQTITSILEDEKKVQYGLNKDNTPAPDVRVKKKRKKNEGVMSEHDYTSANKSNGESGGKSSKLDSSNKDLNAESNGISNSVVNLDLESNADTANKDTDTVANENLNIESNMDHKMVDESAPSDTENMVYSNIESNVESIIEVTNTEIQDIPTNITNADLGYNIRLDTVVEVSDSDSEDMTYSAMYSDFERLQQGASLIKSVQVEILEDDDDENIKPDVKDEKMDVALVAVDNKEQNVNCEDQPQMEMALVEVETNKQNINSTAEVDKMEIVPVEDTKQEMKSNADVDTMTVEIIPVELTKEVLTPNGNMKVAVFKVPNTPEKNKKTEEEEEINVVDDNNDDFPKIPRIKYEWVQAVRLRKELWFPSYASVICSRHFKDECFVHIPHKNRRRLKETAVPTEHLMISIQDHYVDRVRDKDDREKREIRFRSKVIPITEVCEGEEIIKNVYHYLEGQYITLRTYLPDAYDLSSMGDILRRTSDATGVRKETVSDILRNDKLKKKRERFEMKQMNMENFIKELYLDRNPPQNLIIKKFQNPVIQAAEPAPIQTPITPQPGQSLLKTSAAKKTRENKTPKTTSAKTIASIAAKVIAAKTPPTTMAVKIPPTAIAVKTPPTATATKKPKTTYLPKTTAPKTYPGKTAPKTTTKTDLRKTVSTKTDLPKTVATRTDLQKTVSTKTDIRNTVTTKTVSVNTVIAKTKSAKRQRRAPKRVEYKEIRIAPKPSQTTLLPNYSPISSDDEGNGVNVQLDVQEFYNKRSTSFLQHTSDGRLNALNTQSMQLLLWPYVQREDPNEEFGEGFRFSSDTEVENITVEPDIRELCLQEEPNYGAAAEENKKCTCGVQVQMQEAPKELEFHQLHEVPNNPVVSESTQNVKKTKGPTEHTIERILSNIELEATLDVEMDKKSSNNGIEM